MLVWFNCLFIYFAQLTADASIKIMLYYRYQTARTTIKQRHQADVNALNAFVSRTSSSTSYQLKRNNLHLIIFFCWGN